MSTGFRCFLIALAAAAHAAAQTPRSVEPERPIPEGVGPIVDLTHSFDERTIYWPTEDGFRLERGPFGVTEKGYFYAANRFAAAEHGGTHLDAPIHFFEGRQTVDRIPLDHLIGPGALIDVRAMCADDPDYQVGVADFRSWEAKPDRTLDGRIVLVRTGYGEYWPDLRRYLGTEERGEAGVAKLRFPGLDPQAAQWLADERTIRSIGIDTASIDFGRSTHFQSHVTLCERNIPVFENVAHLDQLPEDGFTVVALPMKIAAGSGAPLRIIAIPNR